MGKQNFLQGGFKGKVGAFVGKGWKQMLVIQSAPDYHNPNTEKQRANRSAFAKRVEACKLAMQANYNANFWESSTTTKWALMMSSSSQMYSDTKNILQYTPLIPYGYSPAYTTSEDPEKSGQNVVLSFDTTDDISGRALSVLIYALETATDSYSVQLVTASVAGSSGAWTVTARIPDGYEIGEESYISAVSRDDASFSDVCLYQPPFSIGRVLPTVTFTLTASNTVSWTSGASSVTFSFTPSETVEDASNITAAETNSGVLQGAFTSESGNATISVIEGTVYATIPVTLDSLGQRPLFVSGSSLQVGAFTYEGEEAKYSFAGGTFAIAETPTTQNYPLENYTFEHISNSFRLKLFDNTGWTAAEVSGTLQASTVTETEAINTFSSSLEIAELDGKTYLSTSSDGEIRWGTTQTFEATITATVTKNGVTYTNPARTTWAVAPTATQESLDTTVVSASGGIYTSSANYNFIFRLADRWTWGGFTEDGPQTIAYSLTTESGTTSGTARASVLLGYNLMTENLSPIPAYTDAPTYTITVPQGYAMTRTIANSDGFKRVLTISEAATFSGTMYVD